MEDYEKSRKDRKGVAKWGKKRRDKRQHVEDELEGVGQRWSADCAQRRQQGAQREYERQLICRSHVTIQRMYLRS